MNALPNGFSKWLQGKYAEWMQSGERLRSRQAFAQWLRVHPATLSSWLNETRAPSAKHLHLLAEKLGHEVFKFADLHIQDEELEAVIVNWYRLDETQRKNVVSMVVPLVEEND